MIVDAQEDYDVSELRSRRELGAKISESVFYRMIRGAYHGVKLRTVKMGGKRLTTRKWLQEFIAEVSRINEQEREKIGA